MKTIGCGGDIMRDNHQRQRCQAITRDYGIGDVNSMFKGQVIDMLRYNLKQDILTTLLACAAGDTLGNMSQGTVNWTKIR